MLDSRKYMYVYLYLSQGKSLEIPRVRQDWKKKKLNAILPSGQSSLKICLPKAKKQKFINFNNNIINSLCIDKVYSMVVAMS